MSEDNASLGTDTFIGRYSIGDIGDDGHKIVAILSEEEEFVVYLTENGKSGFDCLHTHMNKNKLEIEHFDQVNSKIFNLLPKYVRRFPAMQLGFALSTCFIYDDDSGHRLISNVEKYVNDKLNEIARMYYVVFSTISFTILAISYAALYYFHSFRDGSIESAIFGGLGALISIFHRITEISSHGFYSYLYISFQGIIRILIGCAFGFICFYLIESDILFGILATTKYGTIIAAIVAGFNERLIPEALGDVKI